jgi:hypothetical protein
MEETKSLYLSMIYKYKMKIKKVKGTERCQTCGAEKAKKDPCVLLLGKKATDTNFRWFCSRKCLKKFAEKL